MAGKKEETKELSGFSQALKSQKIPLAVLVQIIVISSAASPV